jgi:hypothetical protein
VEEQVRAPFYMRVRETKTEIRVTVPWWGWPFLIFHVLFDKQWRDFRRGRYTGG